MAGGVGEDRLGPAVGLRVGERDDVLGVRRGLQPRECPALVADPRDRGHRCGAGPRLELVGDHDQRGRLVPTGRRERGDPAGVGEPQPAERQRPAVEHCRHGTPYLLLVDRRKADARRGPGQPAQVPAQRERQPVDHLHGLEDPVPDGETVMEHRDRGSARIIEQSSVHPCAHGPTLGR